MCDNLHLNSIKQCATPLNTLFFSEFNKNLLQRGIRQEFRNKNESICQPCVSILTYLGSRGVICLTS